MANIQLIQASILAEWAQLPPDPEVADIPPVDNTTDASDTALDALRAKLAELPDHEMIIYLKWYIRCHIQAQQELNLAINETEAGGLAGLVRYLEVHKRNGANYRVKSWQDMRTATPDAQREELMKVAKASTDMRCWARYLMRTLRDSEVLADAEEERDDLWAERVYVDPKESE